MLTNQTDTATKTDRVKSDLAWSPWGKTWKSDFVSWGATGAARGLALGEAGCVSTLAWAYSTLLLACMSWGSAHYLQHFQTLPLIYLHISLMLIVYIYSAFDLPVQVSFVFKIRYTGNQDIKSHGCSVTNISKQDYLRVSHYAFAISQTCHQLRWLWSTCSSTVHHMDSQLLASHHCQRHINRSENLSFRLPVPISPHVRVQKTLCLFGSYLSSSP